MFQQQEFLYYYTNTFNLFQAKIGLWIDLTNTTRFYDKSEVEGRNIKYVKMECRG